MNSPKEYVPTDHGCARTETTRPFSESFAEITSRTDKLLAHIEELRGKTGSIVTGLVGAAIEPVGENESKMTPHSDSFCHRMLFAIARIEESMGAIDRDLDRL